MRTSEARPRGASVLGHLLILAAAGVLVAFGVWQLQRLAWKEDLLQRISALQGAPAMPLADAVEALADGQDLEYRRVIADCPGLDQSRYLRLMVIRDRVAGFRAVSACPLARGPWRAVLVDRGFVAETDEARLPRGEPAPHRAVVAVLRRPSAPTFVTPKNRPEANAWFSRDPVAMGAALGVEPVAPVLLFLESPPPAGFGPTPDPLPVRISNNHLGYAITWFGLAAALIGVYAANLRRGSRA